MSAKKHFAAYHLTHRRDGIVQPRPVARGISRKWKAGSPLLPEGKIAAQDGETMPTESFGKRNQQRRRAIAARAVRQDQRIAARIMRGMYPAADLRINILSEE